MSTIHTYPVKGCRRIDLDSAVVQPWGLEHDRRWLITDPGGVAVTQRDVATLGQLRAEPVADGINLSYQDNILRVRLEPNPVSKGEVFGDVVSATPAGPEAEAWLKRVFGIDARLVWLDDPTRRATNPQLSRPGDRVSFADEYPLLLANTASLARLNDWIAEGDRSEEGPLPMNRFRPNVVVEGARPFQEDEWVGEVIRIGQLPFRVTQGCGRCVVTTTDQETGERGYEPLRTLGKFRNVNQQLLFGVHLVPLETGTISIGDPISL